MSSPTSLKMMHPLFIDPRIRRKHLIPYILHIWIAMLPVIYFEYWYVALWQIIPRWIALLTIPIDFFIMYYLYIFSSLIWMKIRLFFLHLRHKPREGIFPRDIKQKDYKFLSLRNFARFLPSYLMSSTPFPLFRRTLYYLMFGIKMGKNGINWDVWITPEFVEIGENVIIGHSAVILSNLIENDKLLIKKVKIGDGAIIGTKTTIMPGTNIGNNSIIYGGSYTLPFANLDIDSVYSGMPAELINKRDEIDFSLDDVESVKIRKIKLHKTKL
jgi:acetyltransferase-like isoleucine patch superfamily enzyme